MPLRFSNEPARAMTEPRFRMALQSGGALEMLVYGDIGGGGWWGDGDEITAKSIKQQLDAAGTFSKIVLRINSPGGDAFEGAAIYNLLRAQGKPIECYVDGLAASAASVIAMCGDTITMGTGAMLMIHNAWGFCIGYAADMEKEADTLRRISTSLADIYVARTGKSLEEIQALMDAETWLNAQECVDAGFCHGIAARPADEEARAMAHARGFAILRQFKNTPRPLMSDGDAKTKRVDNEDLTWSDFIIAQDHQDISTWHLPWKFSTVEKTKSHLRDALSRFDQVQGLSKEEKHAAWTKLVGLCKKYGIEVSAENRKAFQGWLRGYDHYGNVRGDRPRASSAGTCECDCAACADGNCAGCSNPDCDDPNCVDCPMQDGVEDATEAHALRFMMPAMRGGVAFCDYRFKDGRVLALRRTIAVQMLAGGAKKQVRGMVAPYDSLSEDLGGFREIYQRGCFAESLKAGDDVRVLFNHNIDHVLGRTSSGTARFWEDAAGLQYDADLPDTQIARDLAALMERGDVRESSAAFYILQHRWEQRGGDRVRVIEKAKIVEASPHAFAAYGATTAAVEEQADAEAEALLARQEVAKRR